MDAVSLGWITSAYVLTAAVCILPFGKLSDIYGRKRYLILGNVIFTLGCLLAMVSWSGPVLIAARVIQGLGGSMVFSTSIAVLTSVFPSGERRRAIRIVTGTVYGGLSIGPFLGGILTQQFGWPSIFLVKIPVGIVVIIATLILIPGEWAEEGARTFDLPGAMLYGVMLIGILYGLTLLPTTTGILLMAAGFALLAGFVWGERRRPAPLLDISLFRKNPVFLFSNIAALINYAVVFAVSFLLSLYLQYIRGSQ